MAVSKDGEITEDAATGLVEQTFFGATFPIASQEDPWAMQVQIASRLAEKDTLDDLLDAFDVTTSDNLEGRTFTVIDVDWDTYTAKDTGKVMPLARVSATEDGKKFDFVTTAPNLTIFMKRAQEINALPFTAKIVGNKTSRGFTALHFGRP